MKIMEGNKCTYLECRWSNYTEGTQWGYYFDQNDQRITDCATCMGICDEDKNCTSLECGTD